MSAPSPLCSRRDAALGERHVAEVSLMINKRAGFKARAEISTGGLMSIEALVSTILLVWLDPKDP
jgi:hypothetical protein